MSNNAIYSQPGLKMGTHAWLALEAQLLYIMTVKCFAGTGLRPDHVVHAFTTC